MSSPVFVVAALNTFADATCDALRRGRVLPARGPLAPRAVVELAR